MKLQKLLSFCLFLAIVGCCQKKEKIASKLNNNFIISFGSCNNQGLENKLWTPILKNNPDVWIWGGDIVYSDTEDMQLMKQSYQIQKNNPSYKKFRKKVTIMGTWDDHDYGLNDGGVHYPKKHEVQQILLDFLDAKPNDIRRKRNGVYYSKIFNKEPNSIKIIVLDTRFFRTDLTKDTTSTKRYQPNTYGNGTLLGKEQWLWLEQELKHSTANFNIIVSSIQVLSGEHGWETWANMPHETDKLEQLITECNTKNVIILSGDRHIADISKKEITGLTYPLIDFTSSGMTHSASQNKGEFNKFRVGNLVNKKNFGLLKFNFDKKEVTFEIRGENNTLYESYTQKY